MYINRIHKASRCYLCDTITLIKVAKFALCFSFSSRADIRSLSRTALLSEPLVFWSSLFSDTSLQQNKPNVQHKSICKWYSTKDSYTYLSRFFFWGPLILPFPWIGLIFYPKITLRNNPLHHRLLRRNVAPKFFQSLHHSFIIMDWCLMSKKEMLSLNFVSAKRVLIFKCKKVCPIAGNWW